MDIIFAFLIFAVTCHISHGHGLALPPYGRTRYGTLVNVSFRGRGPGAGRGRLCAGTAGDGAAPPMLGRPDLTGGRFDLCTESTAASVRGVGCCGVPTRRAPPPVPRCWKLGAFRGGGGRPL